MRRLAKTGLVVTAVGLATAALTIVETSGTSRAADPRPEGFRLPATVARPALPHLTPAQLAGQRVIYSYQGLTPPAALLNRIRAGEAAGVIFFGGNYANPAQMRKTIAALNAANAHSPVHLPLLLMTDQEGGEVRRLPGAPTLSEKQIGLSRHPKSAAVQAGTGAGENLRGYGENLNLAPVLDVYRKAGDFDDQYQRSYSRNPRTVGVLGGAFVKAQQRVRVAATAKHFPGLGAASASQNTDERPVTLDLSAKTIRTVDELPYKNAIAAGIKLVMCSWAVYPSLDATHPAGLSTKIVQGELRQRLGFKGVTITDAIEAGALRHFGSIGNRSVLAAGAGMDLIMVATQNPADGGTSLNALSAARSSGRLDKAGFQAAVMRILALRASL
jgi:beta-N-acetylhexosaminidase